MPFALFNQAGFANDGSGKINPDLALPRVMMRTSPFLLLLPSVFLLAFSGCEEAAAPISDKEVLNTDPVIARALNDPLMVDPDLSWINEANAAIAYSDSHVLPAFPPDEVAAGLARDAARIELREGGSIAELPSPQSMANDASLTGLSTLREIVKAVGAPSRCAEGASGDLGWAAKMPDAAVIMPHGMVQQAAGSDGGECAVRVIRYLTQAEARDVLQYHYTKGVRAKLELSYLSGASDLIKGQRAGEKMAVDVAQSLGGLRMVTLVHWRY